MTSLNYLYLFVVVWLLIGNPLAAQPAAYSPEEISRMVSVYKEDPRGPYQGIRWFCPDGTVRPPQERCGEPGGLQHALPKDNITLLAERNGLYLGQILAGTDFESFLDEADGFARLKQYQIERYLSSVDDGWIFRRAQYYRGAFQAEDEERWGRGFLNWLLSRDDVLTSRFFVAREAVRILPHDADADALLTMRSLSKELADVQPEFTELRIKIHGQPNASDTLRVGQFMRTNTRSWPDESRQKGRRLLDVMTNYYRTDPLRTIERMASGLTAASRAKRSAAVLRQAASAADRTRGLAQLLHEIRSEISGASRPSERLLLMDLSLAAESMLFREMGAWKTSSIREEMARARYLSQAAVGVGLLEEWEWEEVRLGFEIPTASSVPIDRFESYVEHIRRVVEWSVGLVSSVYEEEIARFSAFEPLATGFLDDRLRSSVLLFLGESAGALRTQSMRSTGQTVEVMNLSGASGFRGLNPGVAVGRLVVVTGPTSSIDFKVDEIYLLSRAPSEMKPVAGIATVSEGNLVSHVQLLARNLAIPNAVLTPDLLTRLAAFSGQQVFYAVSPGGAVRLKPAAEMTPEERELVEERKRSETRVRVPIDRLDLSHTGLSALFDLRASDSGRLCGPKAANLGQLSSMFPDQVAAGFIVPFGLFRAHMDQPMPGSTQTYWDFLRETFAEGERRQSSGDREEAVENYVLERLATLRDAIEKMPLRPGFVDALRVRFREIFGSDLGQTPVFVRSDTNMEDLKDFTGAGLNLTVPNVVDEQAFLQAIRRVWASPYRERGYRWRQKYLLNPEDVYPSLLVLRSVNVDRSGVLITTGVSSGQADHITVAFNRGVGGAVDGQAAETYDIEGGGYTLLAPAREPVFNTLPVRGGVNRVRTSFERRILSVNELNALRQMGTFLRQRLPDAPGIESEGPFDVELGFLDGEIKLFQARPFVQNQSAGSLLYLLKMDEREINAAFVQID